MKNKIKVLLGMILMLSISLFCGCGKDEEIPELSKNILENISSQAIKQDIYFDQISNIKFEEVETSTEDMEVLKKTFASAVPYKTVHCSANISSISMDAYVEYNLVVAFDNIEWKVIKCYTVNEGEWEYDAKEFVTLKNIMNDLKGIKVGPFEKGYCGNERNSTLVINNRVEDESINRETVYATLTIDTDFGYYNVDIEALYYFKKGEWVIGDFVIPNVNDWKFTFDEDSKIKLFDENFILKKLNTKNEFLTYIVNKDYIKEHSLNLDGMKADTETVTYNYTYKVVYENIGTINYNVDIVYEWLSFEWGEGNFNISVDTQDFSNMKNRKYISGNKYFVIDDVIDYSDEIELDEDVNVKKNSQFMYITYFNGEEKYDLLCNIMTVLRDNSYSIKILDINKNGEEVKRFTDFEEIVLDVNKQTLKVNNKNYFECKSSELLHIKFINEKNSNKYFYVNEILKDNGEKAKITFFDGSKEIKFTSLLKEEGSSWKVVFKIGDKEHSLTIFDDNPYFVKYNNENYYTKEVLDAMNNK